MGGGSPVPTFTNHNTTQKVNIFVKTKNVPYVLKCKINHNFFLTNMGFPNRGRGSPTWEKFSHFPVFLGDVPHKYTSSSLELGFGFSEVISEPFQLPTYTSAQNNFPTFCEKLLFHLFHYGNLTKCCVKSILYFGICLLINFHRHCWPSPFAISVKPNSRFPPSPYYGKCKKLSDICIFQMFQIFQMEEHQVGGKYVLKFVQNNF